SRGRRVLRLDERRAGVDRRARREFWEEIHRLAADGMTFLIATHYMDEAERCHRLAFISYGKLLTQGKVEEVVAEARLTTWVVDGPDPQKLAEELRSRPGVEQAVAFGNEIHVSGSDGAALEAAVAPYRKEPYRWRRVEASLEDVFIHLMNRSQDNFS